MQETDQIITHILSTDATAAEKHHAFGRLVRRFQDMAYGCALAQLGDTHLAEDAAQDAFVAAWQCLPQLRTPAAFPGWLRRLVLTQCHRRTRGKALTTVPLDAAADLPAPDDPPGAVIAREQGAAVHAAIQSLPEGERLAVVLFYIGDYSRAEIAAFLGVSELAVKKRLASARKRLHERMLPLMQDDLHTQRPSRDDAFAERIATFTRGFAELVDRGTSLVRSLASLAGCQPDAIFRAAIEQINQEVQEGQMLSKAMARHSQFFDEHYVRAVRLGEVTGTLEIQLQHLAVGEPIFDDQGRVLVRGVDDPREVAFADGFLWDAIHYGEGRLRLDADADDVHLFVWRDGHWKEGRKNFPELVRIVRDQYALRARAGASPLPQEGRFLHTDYDGAPYSVHVLIRSSEAGEEMTLTLTPR